MAGGECGPLTEAFISARNSLRVIFVSGISPRSRIGGLKSTRMKDENNIVSERTGRRRSFLSFAGYRLALVLVIVLPVIAFAVWWYLAHFVYFNFHAIVPGQAYRSAQPSPAFLKTVVEKDHIRSIIKFNRTVESVWSGEEIPLAKKLGVEMFYVPVGVAELPSRQDMIRIIQAIDHAPRPVLIHCKTGADRSGLAAVLIAMRHGESYKDAKADQLGLRFLHTGHIGPDIDDVLSQYEQDMAAEHKPLGGYDQFRNYVMTEYYPGFYDAGIQPEESTLSGQPGQTVTFKVKVTNLTRRPWIAGWFSTFRLNLGIPGTGSGNYPDVIARANIGPFLAPGKSVLVHLPVKIPDASVGLHTYVLDVGEKHALTFAHYGSPTVNVHLNVLGK